MKWHSWLFGVVRGLDCSEFRACMIHGYMEPWTRNATQSRNGNRPTCEQSPKLRLLGTKRRNAVRHSNREKSTKSDRTPPPPKRYRASKDGSMNVFWPNPPKATPFWYPTPKGPKAIGHPTTCPWHPIIRSCENQPLNKMFSVGSTNQ